MRIDAGGSVSNYVPPQPAPQTYTAQASDSVTSVAQKYQVTPEELARANSISVTTGLHANQVLTLPPNAVQPAKDDSAPKPQTPAQKTDAAIAAYNAAVTARNNTMQSLPHSAGLRQELSSTITAANTAVDQAKTAMDQAISDEISGQITSRNAGVPPDFRTPTDQLITEFGQNILQRHQGDTAVQSDISASINDYRVKSTADALIPSFTGDWSAADKLKQITLQGQSPEVINAVLANPQVQSWINQAAQDIGQPYNGTKPEDAYWSIDKATQAAGNLQSATDGMPPELATAVTQASMPTIQKIAQLQLTGAGCLVPFDTVQSVLANLGSSDQANAVIQQTAEAYASNPGAVGSLTRGDGDQLESSILASPGYGSAGNPNFAIAFGNALQERGRTQEANAAFDAGAKGVQDYLANNGGSPLKAYEAAHSAADEKDQKLAQLLAQSGPLTYDQKQAFIKAYRNDPDNADAYKADAEAAKTLATYMQNNQASLVFAAGHNQDAAKQLYTMMQDVSQSGQGKTALQFAGYVQNDAAASKAFSKFSDYQSTFLPDAVKSAQGELLIEDNGDTKMAGSDLLKLADPVFKGRNGWNQVKEGFEALSNGDTKAFDAAKFAEGYKEMGVGGKVWAAAGITVDSLNGANADQVSEMINAFSMAGGDVSEVGTGVLQVMADAGRFGAFNASAEAMAKLGAKFVPGLAVVASTSAFAADFNAAKNNPNSAIGAFSALAMAGDVISVMGSFMENFPITSVAGEVVTGIGTLISAPFELVAHVLEGNKEQHEFQEEQVKYLEAAGIEKDTAETLAKDGSALSTFTQQLGLDTNPSKDGLNQAEEILMTHPEVFNQGTNYTQGITDLVKACQIKPADVNDFLTALAKDDPNYVTTFYNQRTMASNPATPLTNAAQLVDRIGSGGFANAKAFVQSHAPDVFSADGNARREADYGYELLTSQQPDQVGNLLKGNHDAAYQAEIINIMKNNGTLSTWIQQVGSGGYGYNGWSQAAVSAVQNAQSAGVLSAGQAQQYIGELG
ncbi:LysM peptidoglycan-binding domain-containing protein [Dyella acidisoli]|uniref:LysM domain-containing protein n=1 Tax=Dyella acidisoli TaxID=1867834 RepID=A0ABQ5XSZ7_9GAMM|nr:LysM domain-containing protein [Dyella acidisoli]GLQ93636.1 hypothetical protein GCM10007901_25870 [Dyella acidisoli]